MTWLALAMRHWKIIAAMGAALIVVAGVKLHLAADARMERQRDEARAERDAAQRDLKRLIDESNARKETGKRAVEADKPKAEARAKARTIIQYRESACETPTDIIQAVEKGWQR